MPDSSDSPWPSQPTVPSWGPAGPAAPRAPQRSPLPPAPLPRAALRLEVGLILALAFVPGVLSTAISFLTPAGSSNSRDTISTAVVALVFTLFVSWTPLLVLAYLLRRNGEGPATIGLTGARPMADIGVGLALWIGGFVLTYVLAVALSFLGHRDVQFLPGGLPLWFQSVEALAIALTAGWTEEVVVRGYAQTRLEQLGAKPATVIVLPTVLWAALHLYQGLGSALSIFGLGLLFALFFWRTRRLLPLIVAHVLFDLTALAFVIASHT